MRKSVLIVDDDPISTLLATGALKNDYSIMESDTAEHALDIIKNGFLPDLILLDVGLPGIDGHELCRRLREIDSTKEIPLIFVTSRDGELDQEQGFLAGCIDYITKPFSSRVLAARVKAALLRSSTRGEQKQTGDNTNYDKIREELNKFVIVAIKVGTASERLNRLYIINIDIISKHFGERWAKVSQKVNVIVESMISSNLTKGEAYRYFGDNIFTVIYPTLSRDNGMARIRILCDQICRKLLGEDFENRINGRDIVDKMLTCPELAKTYNEAAGIQNKSAQSNANNSNNIIFEYIPIWSSNTDTIESYRVVIKKDHNGMKLSTNQILMRGFLDDMWQVIYPRMLDDIAFRLTKIDGEAPSFVISVHREFVMSDTFHVFVKWSQDSARGRNILAFELLGLDDNISGIALSKIIDRLKSVSSQIYIRVSPESPVVPELSVHGIRIVGADLDDIISTGFGAKAVYTLMAHYSKACYQNGLINYIWGIDTISDFRVMIAARFTLLSGSVFRLTNKSEISIGTLSPTRIIHQT